MIQTILSVDPVIEILQTHGVFKGAHGLQGFLNEKAFWERQPYGSRFYYGDNDMDYLHVDVLRAAIEILRTCKK